MERQYIILYVSILTIGSFYSVLLEIYNWFFSNSVLLDIYDDCFAV